MDARGSVRRASDRSDASSSPRRHRRAGVEQRGDEAVRGEHRCIVIGVDRVHRRSFDRRRQRHLTARGDQACRASSRRPRSARRPNRLHSVDEKRPTARPASNTAVRSWRRTCSRAHCSGPVASRRETISFTNRRRIAGGVSRDAMARPPRLIEPMRWSLPEANRAAVAHSTRPSTRERCRFHTSWAMGPPIE